MTRANIHDRASVERVYSRDAFERDARENARDKATIIHGVRILSAPDESGTFELAPGSRHAGETPSEGTVPFLAPDFNDRPAALVPGDSGYAGPRETKPSTEPENGVAQAYHAFIDRIAETARTAEFQQPIGLHEERLRGFHGG